MTATGRTPDGWLVPAPAQELEGSDPFVGMDAEVVDFWRWAFSDLRDNLVRGILAEFIVAVAIDRTGARRKNWDNYDLQTASGIRIEVKASGYLQAWAQAKHSTPTFGRVAARSWDENTNQRSAEAEVRADVFVFCLHTAKDHGSYNALDIAQWEFYVVPAEPVRASGNKTVTLKWVQQLAEPVAFPRIAASVEAVGVAAAQP